MNGEWIFFFLIYHWLEERSGCRSNWLSQSVGTLNGNWNGFSQWGFYNATRKVVNRNGPPLGQSIEWIGCKPSLIHSCASLFRWWGIWHPTTLFVEFHMDSAKRFPVNSPSKDLANIYWSTAPLLGSVIMCEVPEVPKTCQLGSVEWSTIKYIT